MFVDRGSVYGNGALAALLSICQYDPVLERSLELLCAYFKSSL